jgi:hypothetical protein
MDYGYFPATLPTNWYQAWWIIWKPLSQSYPEVIMKPSNRFVKAIRGKQRITIERRLFSYTDIIPERRSGQDRRDIFERRQFSYSDFIPERRSGRDRRNVISRHASGDASVVRYSEEKWIGGRQPRQ